MVLAETFDHDIFRKSLARMFASEAEGHLRMAFNATVEVRLRVRAAVSAFHSVPATGLGSCS